MNGEKNLLESVAETDEELMMKFLEGEEITVKLKSKRLSERQLLQEK